MSYRNPQQFVPQSYAQQNQQFQNIIAGTAAKLGAQYAQQQKELRAKNEKTKKENKVIKGRIADRSLTLLNNLGTVDNANPSVDFATLYEPLISQYKTLSESVAFGTSEDPIADQKRIDEIYSSVNKITGTMTNLASFTEDFGKNLDIMGEPGGVFEGSDPKLIEGVSIMTQKLGGKRVPKFKDPNDLNSFVWEVYNKEGDLVYEFSQEKLQQISQGLDEMITTIPNQTKDNDKVMVANKDIFGVKGSVADGFAADGKINDAFLLPAERESEPSGRNIGSDGKISAVSYNTTRKVNKYGTEEDPMSGIYTNTGWNTSMNEVIASVLADGDTSRSAVALANSQFQNVRFTEEDFRKQYPEYATGELPDKIKEAIADKDGYEFDFDKNLTEEEEKIFSVAYKKDFLDTKVRNDMPGGRESVDLQENQTEENKRLKTEMSDYLNKKLEKDTYYEKDQKGNRIKNARIDNIRFLNNEILNDTRIDAQVRDKFKAISDDYLKNSETIASDDFLAQQGLTIEQVKADKTILAAYNKYVSDQVAAVKKAKKDGLIWDQQDQVGINVNELLKKINERQRGGRLGKEGGQGTNIGTYNGITIPGATI